MTITQLRYLLTIVDRGLNITAAAEHVNATQPGLSKQLKQLEDELQLQLFVRRSRNLERLTPAGEEIVRRARKIVAEAENIKKFALNQHSDQDGSLTIETTHVQARYVLPEALAELRKQYPLLEINLSYSADESDSDRRAGSVDVRLFSTDGRRPTGDVAIPLYQWDQVAIARADHPIFDRPRQITLDALAAFPLLTYDNSPTARLSVARTFTDAGLAPRFVFTARDADLIKMSVRHGTGVGIIAEMAVDASADRDLRALPLAGLLPRCTAWAVLPRDSVLRKHLVELLCLLSGLSQATIKHLVAGDNAEETDHATVRHWSDPAGLRRSVSDGPRPSLAPLSIVARGQGAKSPLRQTA